MAISPEFSNFHRNWTMKASQYASDDDAYDKFFTLYVLYNRLYAEATFRLADEGRLGGDPDKWLTFPDAKAAREFVANYLGARSLVEHLEADTTSKAAIERIKDLLRNHRFNFKLNIVKGTAQPDADARLLQQLEALDKATRARAILDTIYSVRCNLFHGRKGFEPLQLELIQPVSHILECVINLLWRRLSS